MKTLLTILAAVVLSIGGAYVLLHTTPKTVLFGDYNPAGAGTYRLQSSVGSTATSITLASFTEPVSGNKYTMSYFNSSIEYGTIEPSNNTSKEFVSFNGVTQNSDGSATLTGVVRGLSFAYPYTASTTFQQAHPGQAIFILSNPPQLTNQYMSLLNGNTIYGINTFSSTSPPRYDQPGVQAGGSYIATTSELASIAYVNAVALVSAPNASTAVKGVVQLATGLQAASSTANGSTGAALVLPASMATDTPNTNTRGSKVLMSLIGGFLNQAWLDLTANWTFTGAVNIAATTAKNFTLNSVAYVFPTAQATASTSALVNDASGNLSWVPISRLIATTTAVTALTGNAATSTVLSITIPGNTLGKTGILRFRFPGGYGLGTNSDASFFAIGYGNSTTTFPIINSSGAGVNGQIGTTEIDIYANGSTNSETISLVSQYTTSGVVGTSKSISLSSTGTYAVDSTQAQPLMITWLGSTSSVNFTWNVLTAEILR